METIIKIARNLIFGVLIVALLLAIAVVVFVQVGIYHPKPIETMEIHNIETGESVPALSKELTVLSYNVQYFAGKDYVFFYDLPDFSGPDTRPSAESITRTLQQIAALIKSEDPDVIMLQEVDEGSARTDKENQTTRLLKLLENRYPYYSEAFYWKVAYVPHPKINGSVGMKLTTLSKAPIVKSTRYQLPRIGGDILSRQFNFCRAVLECHIQTTDGVVALLNTHLDAFPEKPETMDRQVAKVDEILSNLDQEGIAWIIGGDFNLLPPGFEKHYPSAAAEGYSRTSQLTPLIEKYACFPTLEQALGEDPTPFLTHYPNDPAIDAPDKIIDYFFYSNQIELLQAEVMQGETWSYSDHLPLKATFLITR
jgi:endonuclease/exonuclease/phosphatase family metal-dependent hydrolase